MDRGHKRGEERGLRWTEGDREREEGKGSVNGGLYAWDH